MQHAQKKGESTEKERELRSPTVKPTDQAREQAQAKLTSWGQLTSILPKLKQKQLDKERPPKWSSLGTDLQRNQANNLHALEENTI